VRYIILSVLLMVFAFANNEQEKYLEWAKEFKKTLHLKYKIKNKTIKKIFKNTMLLEYVMHKDKNQLHQKVSFSEYVNHMVSKSRIEVGKEKFLENQKLLLKVQKKYKVNAKVIVALWGIESFYGKLQGKHLIIDAILSLIYDGRRAKFFTKELLNTIKILEQNNLQKSQIIGSWAGAMGACQFMPSTYISYAIDGDGDGVKNIWSNKSDIFSSIANLISKGRYRINEPIAVEIQPVNSFAKNKKFSLRYLEKLGIRYKNKKDIKGVSKNTKVTIREFDKRHFLIFDNFKIIKRWNNSDFFAMSVAFLSQKI